MLTTAVTVAGQREGAQVVSTFVHPFEHLRYIARSQRADPRVLIEETVAAIAALQPSAAELVVSCRRLVAKHPHAGVLWWLCSSMLTSPDPLFTASECARLVDNDPTPHHLSARIDGDATVCVVGWPDIVAETLMSRGDIRVNIVDVDDNGVSLARQLRRGAVEASVFDPADVGEAVLASDLVIVEAHAAGCDDVLADRLNRAVASTAYCAGVDVLGVVGRGRALPGAVFEFISTTPGYDIVPIGLLNAVVHPGGVASIGAGPVELRPECGVASELLRRDPI